MANRCRAALALTLTVVCAAAPAALARPADDVRAALATERYYSSFGAPAEASGEPAALATERYLSSYGTPEPLTASTAPAAAPTGDGPSWTAAIAASAVLMLGAAGLGLVAGRASVRPRGLSV